MDISFQNLSNSGILTEENMRGVSFNILDAELHNDAIHRGFGRIIPTVKRFYYTCEMTANPRYLESKYPCNINTHEDVINDIYLFNEESV